VDAVTRCLLGGSSSGMVGGLASLMFGCLQLDFTLVLVWCTVGMIFQPTWQRLASGRFRGDARKRSNAASNATSDVRWLNVAEFVVVENTKVFAALLLLSPKILMAQMLVNWQKVLFESIDYFFSSSQIVPNSSRGAKYEEYFWAICK